MFGNICQPVHSLKPATPQLVWWHQIRQARFRLSASGTCSRKAGTPNHKLEHASKHHVQLLEPHPRSFPDPKVIQAWGFLGLDRQEGKFPTASRQAPLPTVPASVHAKRDTSGSLDASSWKPCSPSAWAPSFVKGVIGLGMRLIQDRSLRRYFFLFFRFHVSLAEGKRSI